MHGVFLITRFFSSRQTQMRRNFCSVCLTKEYLGNPSKLLQRAPFQFLLFKRNIQNRMRLKGPLFNFFSALCDFFRNFFVSKGSPFDFIEVPLVLSSKRL